MKKAIMKRFGAILLAAAMSSSMLIGCADKPAAEPSAAPTTEKPAVESKKEEAPKEEAKDKENVLLWHLWSGDEAGYVQNAVDAFNKTSDKYVVESVSTPDMQKIMVAIQAGNGPDITDDFSSNVGNYASKGISVALDEYIKKDNFDLSQYIPASIEACKYNGELHALPCGLNVMALFYNKTILKEAGYENPPATLEEMYEMAVKTTKTNADGTIDVMGWVDFPFAYYTGSMIAACGGSWYDKDIKPSAPDNKGNLQALQMGIDYRTKFGVDNVAKFQASGKYNDPADPFINGKQAFRFDGFWLGDTIENRVKSKMEYGVTYLPYAKSKPELKGISNVSASTYYIPMSSKCKDGAWEFLKYICGPDGEKAQSLSTGGFPSVKSLLDTPEFAGNPNSEFFKELGNSKSLVYDPATPLATEYNTIISEEVELALNLKQSAQEALNKINKRGSEVFK